MPASSPVAKPGSNTTGFIAFEYTIGAKWLGLVEEMAPSTTRVAVLRDALSALGIGQFAAIQAAGATGIDLIVIAMENAKELEQGIAAFASEGERRTYRDRESIWSKSPRCRRWVGSPLQVACDPSVRVLHPGRRPHVPRR